MSTASTVDLPLLVHGTQQAGAVNIIELAQDTNGTPAATVTAPKIKIVGKNDYPSDDCCFGKIESYPRHWVRSFALQQCVSNVARIISLLSDIIIFARLIHLNPHYMAINKSQSSAVFYPFYLDTNERDLTKQSRFAVMVVSGAIYFFYLFYRYVCHGPIQNLYIIVVICLLFLVCAILFLTTIVYKVCVIAASVYMIWIGVRAWMSGAVSTQTERIVEKWAIRFAHEGVLSSWPLWMVSLVQLQQSGFHSSSLDDWMLLLKLICAGGAIIVGSDKVSHWKRFVPNPCMTVLVCNADFWDIPAPMRRFLVAEICSLIRATEISCSICHNTLTSSDNGESDVYHCGEAKCDYVVCSDCCWRGLISLKEAQKLDTVDFAAMIPLEMVPRVYPLLQNDRSDDSRKKVDRLMAGESIQRGDQQYWLVIGVMLINTVVLGCMVNSFSTVWVTDRDKYRNNTLDCILRDGTLFVFIGFLLHILWICEQSVDWILSQRFDKHNKLSIAIQWTVNISYPFIIFGSICCMLRWNQLWRMGGDSAFALVVFSIAWSLLFCKGISIIYPNCPCCRYCRNA